VRQPVSTLSGGQKNRLMLAKVLADPGSFLILDEPTNDLDMDTLDMLEEILMNYNGTLIVVSHDRDFLDQTVTKILAFEGDGKVESCIGGYSDYLEVKGRKPSEKKSAPEKKKEEPKEKKQKPGENTKAGKLSYKLQYELDHLPEKIAGLENEVEDLKRRLEEPEFYSRDPEAFQEAGRRFEKAKSELEQAENRWLELEDLREAGN
jgi:ATP-binding cassette subfamily F protein uup